MFTGSCAYFYPRPPRGGRPPSAPHSRSELNISIHALREEGDVRKLVKGAEKAAISIHALREEGDPRHQHRRPAGLKISIHALREEGDYSPCVNFFSLANFYPRPPRGGRPGAKGLMRLRCPFLSTPSARRATLCADCPADRDPISIHALREEGDSKNGEKHLRFCFIIKRSAQIWKSLSKNIRKNSCDLHRTA